MLQQRTQLSDHVKGIDTKINDIDQMILGLATVETRLQQILNNEQKYLHKLQSQYFNQVEIEESINLRRDSNRGQKIFNQQNIKNIQNLANSFKESDEEDCSLKKPKIQKE